jgi:hypothetical protein
MDHHTLIMLTTTPSVIVATRTITVIETSVEFVVRSTVGSDPMNIIGSNEVDKDETLERVDKESGGAFNTNPIIKHSLACSSTDASTCARFEQHYPARFNTKYVIRGDKVEKDETLEEVQREGEKDKTLDGVDAEFSADFTKIPIIKHSMACPSTDASTCVPFEQEYPPTFNQKYIVKSIEDEEEEVDTLDQVDENSSADLNTQFMECPWTDANACAAFEQQYPAGSSPKYIIDTNARATFKHQYLPSSTSRFLPPRPGPLATPESSVSYRMSLIAGLALLFITIYLTIYLTCFIITSFLSRFFVRPAVLRTPDQVLEVGHDVYVVSTGKGNTTIRRKKGHHEWQRDWVKAWDERLQNFD